MSEIPDNSATEKPYDFETIIKSEDIVVGTNNKVTVDYENNKVIVDGCDLNKEITDFGKKCFAAFKKLYDKLKDKKEKDKKMKDYVTAIHKSLIPFFYELKKNNLVVKPMSDHENNHLLKDCKYHVSILMYVASSLKNTTDIWQNGVVSIVITPSSDSSYSVKRHIKVGDKEYDLIQYEKMETNKVDLPSIEYGVKKDLKLSPDNYTRYYIDHTCITRNDYTVINIFYTGYFKTDLQKKSMSTELLKLFKEDERVNDVAEEIEEEIYYPWEDYIFL